MRQIRCIRFSFLMKDWFSGYIISTKMGDIRRPIKTGCYVIEDSSTYFVDAVVLTLLMQ